MASVFDPVSARLARHLGFEAGLLGGSVASLAVLGAPDVIVLTLTELVEQVRRCTRAGGVPLVVDADHGYGNALSVIRTVEELGAAQAAGLTIEDTLLPSAFGAGAAPQLISFDEAVGKVAAAVHAGRGSGIAVIGRSSALQVSGLADCIARLRAFEAAGVDALFVPGLTRREDLDEIASATRVPLVAGGIADGLCDPGYLASRRVRLWASGHHTFSVGVRALHDAMQAVKAGCLSSRLPGAAPRDLMDAVSDTASYQAWSEQFLTPPATTKGSQS